MTRAWLACGMVAWMAFAGGAGCATLIKGTRQRVVISASPAGAQVTVYDDFGSAIISQQAPVAVSLRRGGPFSPAEYRIQIEKPGYTPAAVTTSGSLGGWYLIGNLLSWNVVGWFIVDPLSGAMWDLRPRAVNVVLAKQGTMRPGRDPALLVTLPREMPPDPGR
ncbi:MAG: hypothetical protein FJ290_17000 [Planctomycetes bacterium]|nr:hypothetical protein [Planctomycetota bacterium]